MCVLNGTLVIVRGVLTDKATVTPDGNRQYVLSSRKSTWKTPTKLLSRFRIRLCNYPEPCSSCLRAVEIKYQNR